ncbi:Thioredoxin [Penicillium riverlandense]|uniref:Thioredoxin n=1 Tax=Penicillium riverlandense TaxID=1903569 RepID=UPI002548BD6C|nr:Thioredoxin [Penicillium riverlandense]KAJ5815572.1 Thioredoxin [Penicillium riverlandense]
MPVKEITSMQDFNEALFTDGSVVVLDSWAKSSKPCEAIAPVMEELSEKFDHARFYKMDVGAVDDVAQELGISVTPTVLLFRDGLKITEVVGAHPKTIENAIHEALPSEIHGVGET